MFQDRTDAGRILAEKLEKYKNSDAIVLALPRGGVVVGHEVARALNIPLDIVVSRKIGHPQNSEYAICAVDEKGTLLCNEKEIKFLDQEWLKNEITQEKKEAARRIKVYRGGKKRADIAGRIAIIVDDGIATGLSIRLALARVKLERPHRIIVAVPVAPSDIIDEIQKEVDELIVLEPPEFFLGAVGAYYRVFEQVNDKAVIQLLRSL